jgi:OOP family OmpA-OmpF porin
MNTKISTLGSIAALMLGASVANAHEVALPGTIEIPEGNAGYVNSEGNAVRTGEGNCLRLGGFDEENQVNACEGIDDSAAEEVTEAEPEPEAEPAPAPEPVEKEPIVTTATLGGEALFETNSAELSAASEQALAELVSELEKFQEISMIEVTGHTDATGDEDYNQGLSEQRAAAVQAYLTAAYPNANVTSSGLGESSPVATNSTREGRALNRRVEVQVTAKSITE